MRRKNDILGIVRVLFLLALDLFCLESVRLKGGNHYDNNKKSPPTLCSNIYLSLEEIRGGKREQSTNLGTGDDCTVRKGPKLRPRPLAAKSKKVSGRSGRSKTSNPIGNHLSDTKKEKVDETTSNDSDHEKARERTTRNTSKSKTKSSMASKTFAKIADVALRTAKSTVKSTVDLLAAKHVTLQQVLGTWRVEQTVEVSKGAFVTCPATLEFRKDGTVVSFFEDQEYTSEFKFRERAWPKKCTIEFEAVAFQGPRDKEPVTMVYKGYFKGSILNPKIVLIRGKIYKLAGSMVWKRQVRCGKFKAAKRRYQ